MAKWTRYLIGRSWLMRAAFLALAVVLGLAAALWVYPYISDQMLLGQLASDSELIRQKAMLRAEKAAVTSPQTLRRLNEALETADDDLYLTLAIVLRNAGKFHTPQRPVEAYDRVRAIELARSTDPDVREILALEAVAAGRTNRYQKQALEIASSDPQSAVRSVAATLAALLEEDATLEKLLDDKDPVVAAGAAIDAGVAGRTVLVGPLGKVLRRGQGQVSGAAARALARMAPKEHGGEILSLLKTTKDQTLRDCLLSASMELDKPKAAASVFEVVESSRKGGAHPPAIALLAAGRLEVAEAAPAVRDVLRAAALVDGKTALYEEQVLAAIEAAGRLSLDVRKELTEICSRLWGPNWPLVLIAASRELGRQMETFGVEGVVVRPTTQPATQPTTQPAEELTPLQALRLAAVFNIRPPTSQPGQAEPMVITTPVPSAAAAVALWLLEHSPGNTGASSRPAGGPSANGQSLTDMYVCNAAAAGTTLPGEYIAWHLGTSGADAAFKLGLAMLPPLSAPPRQRVYNDNERSAGAMLLALSARTAEQKRQTVERISERLGGSETVGGEDSFFVAGSYRCALAALGQAQAQEAALRLMEMTEFPQRRALTGLLAAGRKEAMDWVLWNWQIPADQVDFLLVGKALGEVVSVIAPELPRVDVAAPLHVRQLQVRALRSSYILNRSKLRVGLTR
ncbi:MAG: hypothetical protein BWX88_01685 [Planctomycetes bacterium ADurb.Bin126]|nr:MAG: hypothetical protein BWX88_01685 [Planctomycetes bacterium ADurb.Bin126]HOD83463.1 hypothetical protein [Phycisphaerae bacterium]HQL73196.1 hypothetical protein [Phycisphaerae bacterium]